MKKLLLVILIIVGGLYFLGSLSEGENVINDEDTYNSSWYEPSLSETGKIGMILAANGIRNCGEFQIKETHPDEYVLACTADGSNWTYYVVYIGNEKVYRANEKMEKKLTPPR
ncbi:hypothetical protein [Autumnicola musiva]|uniref:Uncharacterized protein n=1 Tax=Autumnicola musiva TaxID=3075589 RepID=A0ABU3D333_9FLAO|nr:hypothetical protein [Zunongwangia sp. F117]MDT0675946.1 hypothetical protein [Zunongwangia sp. F117]